MQRAKQEAARDNSAKSLFDFINVRLGGGKKGSWRDLAAPPPTGPSSAAGADLWIPGSVARATSKNGYQNSKNRTPLTKESNERLKIESFKMDERIRGLEREVVRLRDSWHRHRYAL